MTLEEKSSPRSVVILDGMPTKYMILFMRNLNAEDGLLEVVMPVKRYLLNASVAPQM